MLYVVNKKMQDSCIFLFTTYNIGSCEADLSHDQDLGMMWSYEWVLGISQFPNYWCKHATEACDLKLNKSSQPK